MFGWNGTQLQPIGLDIGHDSVRLLQLEVAGASLRVAAAARQDITMDVRDGPDSTLAEACAVVSGMLRNGKFRGRRVVAALPRHIVHSKNLRLPLVPASELASLVQFEARNIFPFGADAAQVEFLPAGEVRQGNDVRQEVIVMAARHSDVDDYTQQLHRAGLIVDSLDLEACALYRGIDRFVRRREDEQEVFVLVEVGWRRTHVLIGKGHDISFCKPIEIGGGKINDAVSRKLGITADEARALRRRLADNAADDAEGEDIQGDRVRQAVYDAGRSTMEDLSREISLCLRYYSVTFRGQRPAKVRLLGGESADPQLLAILNATLMIAVEPGQPLYSVDTSAMASVPRSRRMGEWAVAFGLALERIDRLFAPRDGKPRENAGPLPATAEVIDLNEAISPGGPRGAAALEVANA